MGKDKRTGKSTLDKLAKKASKKALRMLNEAKGEGKKIKKDKKSKVEKAAKVEKVSTKPAKPSNLVGKLQTLEVKGNHVVTIPVKKSYSQADLELIAATLTKSASKSKKAAK